MITTIKAKGIKLNDTNSLDVNIFIKDTVDWLVVLSIMFAPITQSNKVRKAILQRVINKLGGRYYIRTHKNLSLSMPGELQKEVISYLAGEVILPKNRIKW